MRGFDCYYYYMTDKKEFVKNGRTACWAGICAPPNSKGVIADTLYIYKFENVNVVDNKQIVRLVNLINNITPCKIVTIKKEKYIKYKLLRTYDQNLVLLNFIRQLWYENCRAAFDFKKFFDELQKTRRKKEVDPLFFIMDIFKKYIKYDNTQYAFTHSNFIKGVVPKTKEQLFKYNGNSVAQFLKQK